MLICLPYPIHRDRHAKWHKGLRRLGAGPHPPLLLIPTLNPQKAGAEPFFL